MLQLELRRPWWLVAFAWPVALAALQGAEPPAKVNYIRDVRPILKSRCYECHGAEQREAGLRLDERAAALAGGDSGPVIVPGQPAESLLLELIRGDDPDRLMPPKDDPLTAAQIELLTRWIKEGASWPDGAEGADHGRRD